LKSPEAEKGLAQENHLPGAAAARRFQNRNHFSEKMAIYLQTFNHPKPSLSEADLVRGLNVTVMIANQIIVDFIKLGIQPKEEDWKFRTVCNQVNLYLLKIVLVLHLKVSDWCVVLKFSWIQLC